LLRFSWRAMRKTIYSQSQLVISLATSFWRSGRDKPCCSRVGVRSRAQSVFLLCGTNFCWNWRLVPSFTSKELCTLWICYLQISHDQIRCHTLADFTARILIIKDNSRELRYLLYCSSSNTSLTGRIFT